MKLQPFHLAVPVTDLDEARSFYGGLLGCAQGRNAETWVDFNFFGHQLVCHLDPKLTTGKQSVNPVDGHQVPIPHFGVVLEMSDWIVLADRLKQGGVSFLIEPYIRFQGLAGEQATLFLLDPSGNALEFKAFRDIPAQLFAQ